MKDKCVKCQKNISHRVYRYSMSIMKEPMCLECQKEWRLDQPDYPKRLARMVNKEVSKKYYE